MSVSVEKVLKWTFISSFIPDENRSHSFCPHRGQTVCGLENCGFRFRLVGGGEAQKTHARAVKSKHAFLSLSLSLSLFSSLQGTQCFLYQIIDGKQALASYISPRCLAFDRVREQLLNTQGDFRQAVVTTGTGQP